MARRPGQESGHLDSPSTTWDRYVALLVSGAGGWAPLADALIHKSRRAGGPTDRTIVEKGIRRLATRGHRSGGRYGQLLIRFFGVPRPITEQAQWMGQYHSRFADLPLRLREAELALWDRPPIAESTTAAWIHLGLASCALAAPGESARTRALLDRVRPIAKGVSGVLEAEYVLFEARIAPEEDVPRLLARGERVISALRSPARGPYLARLLDQRAYAVLHPLSGAPQTSGALELYRAIPDDGDPFVAFRRAHGIAYCCWKLRRLEEAQASARAACDHAGDAGQIRFRVLAIGLLASIVGGREGDELRARTKRMSDQLTAAR